MTVKKDICTSMHCDTTAVRILGKGPKLVEINEGPQSIKINIIIVIYRSGYGLNANKHMKRNGNGGRLATRKCHVT